MKAITLWVTLFLAAAAHASVVVRGIVIDHSSGQPLADVQVVAGDSHATLTGRGGRFELRLPPGDATLSVSAVGYHRQERSLHVQAGLEAVEFRLVGRILQLADEIVIYGERAVAAPVAARPATTTAALDQIEGVGLVRRANFGLDPVIRGTQPSQVSVVIEGMKIFHACVDRMDPVTSYVETENLDRLEVTRGGFDLTQGAAAGGVVNLITQKPRFDRAFSGTSQVGFESAAGHRFSRSVLYLARSTWAARGSLSYRSAGDLRVGGGEVIDNTRFAKYNYKLDVVHRSPRHTIEASILADEAWDIGYPALLMDARRASSRLYSVVHTWNLSHPRIQSLQTKLYVSTVDHWMDDDDRDVAVREVMPDMYMPMFGKTRTFGWLQTLQLGSARQSLRLILDAYETRAFADMEMISTLPDVATMYLLNLGDVERRHLALTADVQRHLGDTWHLRLNLRLDGVDQDLTDPMGRAQMAATWGDADLAHRYTIPNLSMTLSRPWRQNVEFTLGLSDHGRIPTQLESYGFFLYNPADGFFYTGQPQLAPERGRQIEAGVSYAAERRRLQLRVHHSRLSDYITGVVQESVFKTYENVSRATLTGAEALFQWPLSPMTLVRGSASYTRGQNDSFDEPLPFVAPLEGRLGVLVTRGKLLVDGGVRFAARQTRIANRTTREDETPGFVTLDLRAELPVTEEHRLEVALENVLDRRYHEHLSVGNFPSPGRNLRIALDLGF